LHSLATIAILFLVVVQIKAGISYDQ